MQKSCQKTLKNKISVQGVALHSGKNVTLTLVPAKENSGIVFKRTDLKEGENTIVASPFAVVDTMLCSKLSNNFGATIGTVEHLTAALHALGIDNVIIEADDEEIPVLDGSSEPWLAAIDKAGIKELNAPKNILKVVKPCKIEEGNRFCAAEPANEFIIDIAINYNHPNLPEETETFVINEHNFRNNIAKARTFCLEKDIDAMRNMGLIKGGSLENAVVFGENGILNKEGARFENPSEALRHKVLDCIGDLFLTGKVVQGKFTLKYPGHGLNNLLLRQIVEDNNA